MKNQKNSITIFKVINTLLFMQKSNNKIYYLYFLLFISLVKRYKKKKKNLKTIK